MSKKAPEDAFNDNLLLGLNYTLNEVPGITDVTMEKRDPCTKYDIYKWEEKHGVHLPEDMKKFYLSTDGLLLQWSYQYTNKDIKRVGFLHIPHLENITWLANVDDEKTNNNSSPITCSSDSSLNSSLNDYVLHNNATSKSSSASSFTSQKDIWGNPLPLIGPKSKIFELYKVNKLAKVCLIYDPSDLKDQNIYLLELDDLKWVFLAQNFSEYLRMAIAHLGLPYWEMAFTSCGLPPWAEQLFLLLAPHLLEAKEPRRRRYISPAPERPYNIVNPDIFRSKIKTKPSKTSLNIENKYDQKN